MQKIKYFSTLVFLMLSQLSWAQKTTEINGYAPAYVGQKIELFEIEDFFTMRESVLAVTTVGADSTFKFQFFNNKIQKVIIKSNKNKGFLYIQPGGKYTVFMPDRNLYDPYRPSGNDVEIGFYDLETTDINSKILAFDESINSFLGTYFPTKKINGTEFVTKLDTFKMNIEKIHSSDTSLFFKTYIKYSIASLDDIQYTGTRNRYEKFDFYINNYPVVYDCDMYMSYISSFYENVFARLTMEVNNRVYHGLLKSSPTMIMRALGEEYTLRPTGKPDPKTRMTAGNTKLRELIMIKGLGEIFYSDDFPQTNILTVLDSISKHSIFKSNGIVARNMIYRLTELVSGSKAPEFVLKGKSEEVKSLRNYTKKHLYIQFLDPTTRESAKEVELLKTTYAKYKSDVNVITVYEKNEKMTQKQKDFINEIPWETFEVSADDAMLKSYHAGSFPLYVLIDAFGYVVSSPALGPKPNGQYETIDKIFFEIKKMNDANR